MTLTFEQFKHFTNEAEVQHSILQIVKTAFGINSTSFNYSTDGLLKIGGSEQHSNLVLCEFKYDMNFSTKRDRAKVLSQVLFYMKRLETVGDTIAFDEKDEPIKGSLQPSVILVADKNEYFVLHTNHLLKYLDRANIKWETAASRAFITEPALFEELVNDSELHSNIWVNSIDSMEDLVSIPSEIIRISNSEKRKVRIHKGNMVQIFGDFTKMVLKEPEKLNTNQLVALFLSCILDSRNEAYSNGMFLWHYDHLNKDLVKTVPVYGEVYTAFWNNFDRENYSITDIERLVEVSDTGLAEARRRVQGAYYTPSDLVAVAHQRIADIYGENWKEEYVVWDCACGTGNLTRGYKFKELYMSTLHGADLVQASFLNEAKAIFEFDFLNGHLSQLPVGLQEALEKKKVIFLINPPYAAGKNKIGTTKTAEEMQSKNITGSFELTNQFMYRISKVKAQNPGIRLAMFSKFTVFTGTKGAGLREHFLTLFKPESGLGFQGSLFPGVKKEVLIGFTVWS